MPRSEDTPLIKEEISERIEDLASRDGKGTAISLALVALEILARQYPPKLDDKDRLCIRDNYPWGAYRIRKKTYAKVFRPVVTA